MSKLLVGTIVMLLAATMALAQAKPRAYTLVVSGAR